jgi:uroporphyrinogen-III decarboxylase
MRDTMTPRERWLAALTMQPVDRLPFWPKIYDAYLTAHRREPDRATLDALHAYIGSDRHEGVDACLVETRTDTAVTERREDDTLIRSFTSPRGSAVMVERWDAGSHSWHPLKFPAETREDILILTDVYRDRHWSLDDERLRAATARKHAIGENAIITTGIGESPFMWWLELLAGIANGHLLLHDYPEEVAELLAVMHAELRQRAVLLAERHPADLFYMIENTSTTLLSPAQYREYCLPYLREYVEILHMHDRLTVLHMCGLLKRLLPDIAQVGARAFEAFTSPPVGDTVLADGRAACPETCLIGGTNAVLWTQPAEAIIAEIDAHLAVLPHTRGLVITSAGMMPPLATPETIRAVAAWVRAYAVRQ